MSDIDVNYSEPGDPAYGSHGIDGSGDLRKTDVPVAFVHLISNEVDQISKEYGEKGKGRVEHAESVPLFSSEDPKKQSDADYVWTTVMNNVVGHYPEWVTFFGSQGVTPEQATADASVIVYKVLIPKVKEIYNELKAKGNDATLRDAATVLGNISPQSLKAGQASAMRTFISSAQTYQSGLIALKKKENSLTGSLASDMFQLQNDLAYLKEAKAGTERDALENRVKQLIEHTLPDVRSKVNGINAQIASLSQSFITFIDARFSTICGICSIPPDAETKPMSEAEFDEKMGRLKDQVTALEKSSIPTIIAEAHDLENIGSLTEQIYKLDPDRFKDDVLDGDPKNGLRNILGDGGPGIWFDTSRILNVTSPANFREQLDTYFRQMAQSGITNAKLSFAQFSKKAGQADTVATMLKAAKDAHVSQPMAVMAAEAAKWGINLGISVGGEDGTAATLDLGSNPSTSATLFWSQYGQYCKNGIDLDIEGGTIDRFLTNEGQENITKFFSTLRTLAQPTHTPIQLTLCGSVGKNAKPLAFLFKGGYIDSVNIMAYNGSGMAYLTPSIKTDDYGAIDWVGFLVDTCGITPDKAMSMLHWGAEDATPYSDASKTGWSDPDQLDQEVSHRVGKSLEEMDPGSAFSEEIEQLRIDTIREWNLQHSDKKISSNARFGSQMWWIDEGRVSNGQPLALYPEAGAAARQIVLHEPKPTP
ncbi:MAG: glycosyl hydrolase family 18 protein [Simkaniaceae bacterium]|nr:glycosyl hydrolase family 18 protein [Simkaniaceae bacterium]